MLKLIKRFVKDAKHYFKQEGGEEIYPKSKQD